MLKTMQNHVRQFIAACLALIIATLGKCILNLLLYTCSWEVIGSDVFLAKANKEKCLLALWHNRLAITPFLLHRFVPNRVFAALISKSRDGKLLDYFVRSYKNGRTIGVYHHSRHAALKSVIDHVEKKEWVIVVTPDGPRGPKYSLKPGLPQAAFETQAHVFTLNWSAESYWELKTWDGLRIPKPFTNIKVHFTEVLPKGTSEFYTLEEAKNALTRGLVP